MKIGMNIKIDVTKLDKTRFFKGNKGTYADLTAFIDTDQVSEYGDNGTIVQQTSKEERQNGVKLPILGNCRVFYTDGQSEPEQGHSQFGSGGQAPDDDQIPF